MKSKLAVVWRVGQKKGDVTASICITSGIRSGLRKLESPSLSMDGLVDCAERMPDLTRNLTKSW